MKKIAWIAIVIALAILTGCVGGEAAPEGSAAEIADKIFAEAQVQSFGLSESLQDDAKKEFYLGTSDYPEFADSVVVAPMINVDTRLMVIIKAADKGGVEEIEKALEENIDPLRLICVTFTMEDVAFESRGDVILMTINTDAAQREALVEAFRSID